MMTCQDDDLLCVSSIIDISPNQGHLQIQVGGAAAVNYIQFNQYSEKDPWHLRGTCFTPPPHPPIPPTQSKILNSALPLIIVLYFVSYWIFPASKIRGITRR